MTELREDIAPDAEALAPSWCVGCGDGEAFHATEFDGPDGVEPDTDAVARLVQEGDAEPVIEMAMKMIAAHRKASMPMTATDDTASRAVYILPPGVTIESVFALREELAARSARANQIVAEHAAARRVFLRSPDEALAAALRDLGDLGAFEELCKRYQVTVMRLAYAAAGYGVKALADEVFGDAQDRIGEFTGTEPGSFARWLTEVIVPPVIEHRGPAAL